VLLLLLLLLLLLGEDRKFTALKVKQCPLVLLVKVGWRQGTDLGSKEGVVGCIWQEEKFSSWAEF